ncbi:hypothetical protein GCM10010435_85230 [Winogradskya consettensis]|uniref:DUF4034 domain-containing protein n=1 Tax=Winogradskya consettensis TaxID=113560 RepID=A0A919VQW8_9ACTN|nr:DUF4034 domain-containing protein [Actinoplanes consettensis]GIM72612.1 hypothetical protein Aco04nite_31170 [Actinoplanes consettensis]
MWPFKRDKPAAPTIVFDPTFGDPTARSLIAAADNGDWKYARDVLTATTDSNIRAFLLGVLCDRQGPQPWIDQWVAAEPHSALPFLVKGSHAAGWAWQARGNGGADTVSQEQFAVFFRRLKVAEDALDDAIARDPDNPIAWTELIHTAVGRQLGLEEAERRFEQVIARNRWHRGAYHVLLQQKCAKWGGSDELALDFARRTVAAMPDGNPLGTLIAWAHFEIAAQISGEDYLARPEVVAEVHAAANRSIFHPAFPRTPGFQSSFGIFAIAFGGGGEARAAQSCFDAIGDYPSEQPWSYLGDPATVFLTSRENVRQALS